MKNVLVGTINYGYVGYLPVFSRNVILTIDAIAQVYLHSQESYAAQLSILRNSLIESATAKLLDSDELQQLPIEVKDEASILLHVISESYFVVQEGE